MRNEHARRGLWALGALTWVICGACSGDESNCRGELGCAKPPSATEQFESDPPPPLTRAGDRPITGPTRPVLNGAELTQLHGDRLIAIGADLSVIDVADPNHLVWLGHYPMLSTPLELYVRGDLAIVLSRVWSPQTSDGNFLPNTLQVLDLSNPSNIQLLASFDVPGRIEHTKLTGDTLYIVTSELERCEGCSGTPDASIAVRAYDVRDPRAIERRDELRYTVSAGGFTPHHAVLQTDQRIYVASLSRIQVVDLSDPSGRLALGAKVQARVVISRDSHMDEYQGALRVADLLESGPHRPELQTFRVVSSHELQPLAQLDLAPPNVNVSVHPLVRFDGPRAYVFGPDAPVPLQVLDLAEPSQPKQVGQLEVARISHVEPLGDRLLTLGESNDKANTLALSLYDTSEAGAPKPLSRVNFGGAGARVLDPTTDNVEQLKLVSDDHLILTPFSGYDVSKGEQCGLDHGLQLIDYDGNQLTRRSSVRTAGQVRRTLPLGEHALAIGWERVEAITLRDRSALLASSATFVARYIENVAQLENGVVARINGLTTDTPELSLEFVAAADAEDLNRRLRTFRLRDHVGAGSVGSCGPGEPWVWDIHADGNRLYVVYAQSRQGVLSFDASDPSSPRLVGQADWDPEGWNYYRGAVRDRMLRPGFVWRGSTLALLEKAYPDGAMRVRVVDLSDAANPSSQLLPLSAADDYIDVAIGGDTLFASHYAQLGSGRVRYDVERFDLSNPRSPRALGAINSPGAVLHYFPSKRLAITRAWQAGQPRLQLVRLAGDGAELVDNVEIDPGFDLRASAAGDGVVFVSLGRGGDRYDPDVGLDPAELLVLDVSGERLRATHLALGAPENQLRGFWGAPLVAAEGKRALLAGLIDVAIVDAANPADPKLTLFRSRGEVIAFDLRADRGLIALGWHGLQAFEM